MKKILALILAACMVLSMGAVVQAEGVSGEFTGTANGMGEVTVTLTLDCLLYTSPSPRDS